MVPSETIVPGPISGRNIPGETKVPPLYITEFCQSLLELARKRVRSGEVSERGLARLSGISQPHMHNVLKGIRALSIESADRLMRGMEVTIPLVVWAGTGIELDRIIAIPVLRNRIGPGIATALDVFRGYMAFPLSLVERLKDPVAGYLAADLALPSEYRAGDAVLLDLNPAKRIALAPSSCWIVAENGALRVRYVRRAPGGLEVVRDPGIFGGRDSQTISLQGSNILEIVRARIVWIGREMEAPLAGPPHPPRAGD